MKKNLLLTAILSVSAFTINAQSFSSTLDSVVIKEDRIEETYGRHNRNIQIIDQHQIKNLPVKTVNDLLSYVAGVDLRQRGPVGTQADVSIDGSTFDQVLVMVNGVKMTDPQTGHHMMNLPITIGIIDHIEVVRGPAARSYGVNALAGVINIITKQPLNDEAFVQAYAGSSFMQDTATGDTYLGWGVQASASLSSQQQVHTIGASTDEGNGYRYNTAYKGRRFFYNGNIKLNSRNQIDLMGGYVNNSFGANGYYASPVDAESEETVQTGIGSIKYTFKPNSKLTISPRVSYRYNKDDYIFIRQKPSVYHNIHSTNVLTGELQASYNLYRGIIGAGVTYRDEAISSNNLGDRERTNLGIFAEYKHYFSSRINASIGAYANKNSDYDWEVFPGADIGILFAPNWKFFANATMGQRLPTYTDLYYSGPTNIGNPLLKPEYANYAEGGLKYDNGNLFAQAAYFYRNTTDFIDWVRAVDTLPWQPQNYQSVNVHGATLQTRYHVGHILNLTNGNDVSLIGSYTYLSPTVEVPGNNISKYTINALRHQAIAKVNTIWLGHIQANAAYRYLYRINGNDYTLLDARLGYALNDFLFYADVNNILDTRYREAGAVQLPGRWVSFGIRFNPVWK